MAWANLIVLIVTAVGIGASGLFLGVQARHLAKQSKVANKRTEEANKQAAFDAYQTAARDIGAAMSVFIERPEIRKYIRGETPLPDDEDTRNRAITVGENVLDALAGGVDAADLAGGRVDDPMNGYARDILAGSPLLRDLLNARPRWWPKLVRLQYGEDRNAD